MAYLAPAASCKKADVTTNGGIVIVGGGLAAARTAEQLRKAEYAGPITLISDEVHLPYDRPPLSKDVLRAEVDDTTLKPAEFYAENNITLLLGSGAVKLDTEAQTVTLAGGEVVAYEELVIATGLVPRLPTAVLSMGLMTIGFISFACGLILDTVSRGRSEMKRMRYLSTPPAPLSP